MDRRRCFVVLAVCLFSVSICVTSVNATIIFSDGFESGDFSAWSYTEGYPVIQSDIVHSGSYAGFSNTTGTQRCVENLSAISRVSVLVFYRFGPVSANWTTHTLIHVSDLDHPAAIAGVVLGHKTGDEYWWELGALNGSNYIDYDNTTGFVMNYTKWYAIEVEVSVSDSEGYASLYIDGDLVANATGIDNNNFGNIDGVVCGSYWDSIGGNSAYWDDCVISDTYIGLEPTETPPVINSPTSTISSSPTSSVSPTANNPSVNNSTPTVTPTTSATTPPSTSKLTPLPTSGTIVSPSQPSTKPISTQTPAVTTTPAVSSQTAPQQINNEVETAIIVAIAAIISTIAIVSILLPLKKTSTEH